MSGVFIPTSHFPSSTPRIQPFLLEVGKANPNQTIAVIVQKDSHTDEVENIVIKLGGRITKRLNIINAFVAEMAAGKFSILASTPGVKWISLDAPIEGSKSKSKFPPCKECISTDNLQSAYITSIGADQLWNTSPYLQGQGITVAIVDSGIRKMHPDFSFKRIVESVNFNPDSLSLFDEYGHGTHIAGIVGGMGRAGKGEYIGVAPEVNLISVKVTGDDGSSLTSDVVAGLNWVYDNYQQYNIRVVNLSLNSSVDESYHTNPLDAAVEILWFNGIVVVVSAGNNTTANLFPPANDPFVISVGAINDLGTPDFSDDVLAAFSPYNSTTIDGFSKPDLLAPGVNIVAPLASKHSTLAIEHPDNIVGRQSLYFRMSGTSMASAVTAGSIALLLQDEPYLNPDQVKYRLINTAKQFGDSGKYLDILAAVQGTTTETSNTGIPISQLLFTGSDPVNWGSVNWGSVNWGSVNWGSVNWGSVNWGSVNWGSVDWSP